MCIRDSNLHCFCVRTSIVKLRMQTSGRFPSLTHAYVSDEQGTHTLLVAMCLQTQAASTKKESVGRVCPLHHLVGTVSMCLSQPASLSMRAYTFGDDVCCVSYGSVHLSVCCVCHVCVCTRVTSSSRDTSGASKKFRLELENRSVQLAVFPLNFR